MNPSRRIVAAGLNVVTDVDHHDAYSIPRGYSPIAPGG